jgi:iron(III) transport system ATP-binding protein
MAELHINGLVKRFGASTILQSLDMQVTSGSLTAILGPSGSGKTTLLRLICGFDRANAGTISIAGNIVSGPGVHLAPEHRHIGYVAQEGALFPHLSVARNITFGLPRAQRLARHRVEELLELVGLPVDFAHRAPQQLSGGQQQRVALARALAPNPALVLLDEPFSALDASLRQETRSAIAQALQNAGATAVLVTHDQSEALSMGHQVAVLWEGQLVQVGTPQNIYRNPISPELARFIGDAVLLPGRCENGVVHCALGALPSLPATPQGWVNVMVRPEQIRLLSNHQAPADTDIAATCLGLAFNGHDAIARLQLASDGALVTARLPGYVSVPTGAVVRLVVEGAVTAFAR